jgi:hypothetical protein
MFDALFSGPISTLLVAIGALYVASHVYDALKLVVQLLIFKGTNVRMFLLAYLLESATLHSSLKQASESTTSVAPHTMFSVVCWQRSLS